MKKWLYVVGIAFGLTTASGLSSEAAAQTVKEKTKKGWSRKAKGTAIGAGAGAATGVIVSRNDSKGAAIGGAIGAGAGYLYGRHKDKKKPKRSYKYKREVEY